MGAFLRILIIIASVFLVGVGIVIYLVYNSSPAQQKVLEEKSFTEDIEAMEIMVDNSRVETMPSDGASSRIMLLGNGDGFSLNTKAAGGRLAIEVEDRPPPFFNFDFNRSYTLQVYVPASGLGLAISKEIIELHKGTIGLHLTDGRYVFWFTIPLEKSS